MRISAWKWLSLYGVLLAMEALALFFFQSELNLASLPLGQLLAYSTIALAFPGIVIVLALIPVRISSITVRKALAWNALFTLRKAVAVYSMPVQAASIGEQDGNLVVRLPLGEDNGMVMEQRVLATNMATVELLGILEPMELEESSCLLFLSDRISIEFWEELDARRRKDFSPPGGVMFSREMPNGLVDFAERVIAYWRK